MANEKIKPVKISSKKFNPSKYIDIEPKLVNSNMVREDQARIAAIVLGHFSPPTIADQRLVESVKRYASLHNATPFVFATRGDVHEGYLSEERRLDLIKETFDVVTCNQTVSDVLEAAEILAPDFNNLIVVVAEGSNITVPESIPAFESVVVVPYADPLPYDAIAEHFINRDLHMFKQTLHTGLRPYAAEIYEEMCNSFDNSVINESLLTEKIRPMSYAERIKRAQTMRRYAKRIEIARERAAMRRATPEKIIERARKKALEIIRARILKNKDYAELSIPEKNALDKQLMRIPAVVIDRITRKLVPVVRKAEAERMSSRHSHHVSTSASSTGHHSTVNEAFASFVQNELEEDTTIQELFDLIEAVENTSVQRAKTSIQREKHADAMKHQKMMTAAKRADLNRKASREFASLQKRTMQEAESEVINKIIDKELERKKLINAFKGYTAEIEGLDSKTRREIEKDTKEIIAKNDIKHFTHKDLMNLITKMKRAKLHKKAFNATDVIESTNPEDSTPDQREWGTDSLTNIYKQETPGQYVEEKYKPKGLWYNIRKRREKGLRRLRPGEKGYPKTLDIEKE